MDSRAVGGRPSLYLPTGALRRFAPRVGTRMAATMAEMFSALYLCPTLVLGSPLTHLRVSFSPQTCQTSSGPSGCRSVARVQLFATPWTAARQASLSIISSHSLLKLMFIALVMSSNHLILYHPLLLPPSIFPSIRVFSNESVLHIKLPNDWSLSFSISPSNEYSWLISFRIDWFGIFAVQGTLKSLLQHHNSEASIPRCSAFFMVQLSHPYMTTGKIIASTICTFVGKVMSLFFNTLPRFVIAFHGPEHSPNSSCASETRSAAAPLPSLSLMVAAAAWLVCSQLLRPAVCPRVHPLLTCFTHLKSGHLSALVQVVGRFPH